MNRLSFALIAALLASPAFAQTVPIVSPNTVNGSGQPTSVTNVFVRNADGTIASVGGGSGGSSGVAQGSTTAGQSGPLTQAAVVSGDQAYTVGQTQPLNLTATGRLKVGTSYTTNVTPGTIPATTLGAALVACQYRASPLTWADTNTGSLRCDSQGRVATILEQPLPAGTNALGSVIAGGPVAGGAASAGNPVLIGCDVLTSPATVVTGNRAPLTCSTRGGVYSVLTGSTGAQAQVGTVSADAVSPNVSLYTVGHNLYWNGANWDRSRGDTTGAYVVAKGTTTLTSGQVSVGTTATQIVAALAGAARLTITVDAAVKCYIGAAGVTTTTGYPLQATAGASHTMVTSAAVFMVCASTATVGYLREN